jgi:hypothetical protein
MGLPKDSFAQMPTPQIDGRYIKVFFSSRNSLGQSVPHQVILNLESLAIVSNATPLNLTQGELGTFDHDGIMPSSIISIEGIAHLYYVGWSRAFTTPYQLGVGLAIKKQPKEFFEKIGIGPIVDKSLENPFFVTTPQVFRSGPGYKMLFTSGKGWERDNSRIESLYGISEAFSIDGVHWANFKTLDFGGNPSDCLARPFFIDSHTYISRRPKFNFRSPTNGYRIEMYLKDNPDFFSKCHSSWNSEIEDNSDRAYASLLQIGSRKIVLYNGEGFGKNGFHVAEEIIIRD